jgi:hypothetical protein
VGFAGQPDLSAAETERAHSAWCDLLAVLARCLHEVSAAARGGAGYYATDERPLLRIVTGLTEGADQLACGAKSTDVGDGVDTELAAILPFEIAQCRASRPTEEARKTFDEQLAGCGYVVTLDGVYDASTPATPLAARRNARAYRAQSALLLRHSDLLVAVVDAARPERAGGTLESARGALLVEVPVVVVDPTSGAVRFVDTRGNVDAALSEEPVAIGEVHADVAAWAERLLADPSAPDERVLDEYFRPPPSATPRPTVREWMWKSFEDRFRDPALPRPDSDAPLAPFTSWRPRAAELSRRYAGMYRGAFLLNYGLAVLAVTLATLGLLLLAYAHESEPRVEHARGFLTPPSALTATLLAFGVAKLAILIFIARNTHEATTGAWNERGVDFRYLGERLRAMYYLPKAGSFRPPAPTPPHHASRALRQSAVDWLFAAIVRGVSPAALARGTHAGVPVLAPSPLDTIRQVRDGWIAQQARYHAQNAHVMHGMREWAERVSKGLNVAVIWIVALDLSFLFFVEVTHDFEQRWSDVMGPLLLSLAAILPAAVASLNGVRVQSESRRLAERSSLMRAILRGERADGSPGSRLREAAHLADRIEAARKDPATDPGAWSLDVVMLTEAVARDFAREVGDWSVVYSAELAEP